MKKRNMGRLAGVMLAAALALTIIGCTKDKPAPDPAKASDQAPAAVVDQKAPDAPAPPAAAAGEKAKVNLDKLRYVMRTETETEGKVTIEFMVDKPRMKMKVSGEQQGEATSGNIVCDGSAIYMIDDNSKTAIKMPMSQENLEGMMPTQEDFSLSFEEYKDQAGEGAIKETGTADFHGEKVTAYEIEEPMTKAKVQLYVDGKDLVRRIDYTDPDTKAVTRTEVLEIDTNPKFTDADFKVPDGYAIQDMTGMMAPPQ